MTQISKPQKYWAEYEVLTPVHVGSGIVLKRNFDFITEGSRIYILDDKKILETIGEAALEKWVSAIDSSNIKSFLQQQLGTRFRPEKLASAIYSYAPAGELNELRMGQIGLNGEYILPGSSIKGSIRTALFTSKVKQRQNVLVPEDVGFHEKTDRQGRRIVSMSDSRMLKNAFGPDPNFNFMRFLKIGDVSFQKESHHITPVDTLNQTYYGINKKQGGSQLLDVIQPGSKGEGAIILDEQGWNTLKNSSQGLKEINYAEQKSQLKNLDDFLDITYNHTCDLIKSEFKYWDDRETNKVIDNYLDQMENIYNANFSKEETILRVGFGNGWMWMTGGWTEAKINNTGEKLARNISDDIQAAARRERYIDHFPLPKTRKMTSEGMPLGFIKIKIKNYGHTDD